MAGISKLIGTLNVTGAEIGYYFENWNTEFLSIAAVLVLVVMISGYFYGRVMQKFIKPLKDTDCTFLGICFILMIFQIYIFYAIAWKISTDVAFILVKVLIFGGPVLCLVTLSNPLPSWKHLASIVTGIIVAIILGIASSKLTTNNIFFDSVYYLSETIESSTRSVFGAVNYYTGVNGYGFDKFHDLQSYYYFWGMLLRWARDYFELEESLTPIYLWGASFLYYVSLGGLAVSSVNVLFKKYGWKAFALPVCLLILSPYYTNYFNTTLGFFGNTIRTVTIGYSLLIAYLFLKKKDPLLFIPLMISYYGGVAVSSSSFFLIAFLCAGLFFAMCIFEEKRMWAWLGFILSCMPLFHYALIIALEDYRNYWLVMRLLALIMVVLLAIAVLLRKHFHWFCLGGKIILPVAFAGLCALAYLNRNGEFGYSYFFEMRSLNDMCNNFTSSVDDNELYRNIIFYVLLACTFVNLKKNFKFKTLLLIITLLFLNPLVQPAVSTLLTSSVYSRSFDLLVNPFTLIFLISNFEELTPYVPVQAVVLAGVALFSYTLGKANWENTYSKPLTFKEDGYNWEYKVSDDAWDIYSYIQENLAGDENDKPVFLSQDASLKGYVVDIEVAFGASDFRDSLDDKELFEENHDMMTLLYPEKITDDILVNDEQGDWSHLSALITKMDPDYVLMRNTIAVWNERGWYEKAYNQLLDSKQATVEYENTSWVILKIDRDWKEPEAEPETEETEEESEETEEIGAVSVYSLG